MYGNELRMVSAFVQMQKTGNRFYGKCPLCGSHEKWFSADKDGNWQCVACGKHGDAADLIAQIRGISKKEADDIIRQNAGLAPAPEQPEDTELKRQIYVANHIAQQYYEGLLWSEEGKDCLEYFRNRKLTDQTIRTLHLGYAGGYGIRLYQILLNGGIPEEVIFKSGLVKKDQETGKVFDAFWKRAMFPIHDAAGRTIAFGGRVMDDSKPKYINSPETPVFDKSRVLYGLYEPSAYSSHFPIVLCEGYMDVISMYQAGVHNAVATLGTAITPEHAKLISRYGKSVNLCYDSDGPGVAAALRAVKILKSVGVSAGVVSFTPCKDPDELVKRFGVGELYKRFAGRQDSFLFEANAQALTFDPADAEQKKKLILKFGEMLFFEDPHKRSRYIRILSDQYRIPQKALWAVVDIMTAHSGGESMA